jgi:hypothetical protein
VRGVHYRAERSTGARARKTSQGFRAQGQAGAESEEENQVIDAAFSESGDENDE